MQLGQPLVTAQTIAGPLSWRTDGLTSQQFLLGSYEAYMQEAFAKFVCPGATVYDVGAHAGYHSLLCALLVGSEGRVIAFEPNPANRESIKRQLAANPEARISLSPYALSDRCQTMTLDVSYSPSQGRLSSDGDVRVEARQIDFLIENENFPDPDVIKIDVEGHEEEVIRGARATIDRCRPIILCDWDDSTTFAKVSGVLGPQGYEVSDGWPITAVPREKTTAAL
jgi:FkbM family methyltransferase